MKVFTIGGITAKAVCEDLARNFETEMEGYLTEYAVPFPESLGTGQIQGINFPSGIGLLRFRGKLSPPLLLRFKSPEVHPLKFFYCTRGSMEHSMEKEEEPQKIQQYQSAIISSYYTFGHTYHLPSNETFDIEVVEIDRKQFKDHINYKLNEIPYPLFKMFGDVEGINKFYSKGEYSLKIAGVIKEMEDYKKMNLSQIHFLAAKALEIISLMLEQYEDDGKDLKKRKLFRKSELETVRKVAEYMQKNLADLETIEGLSRKFGLSVLKLQEGFQLQYQQTVNGYLNAIRMEKALELLDRGDKNISETVYAVGLSSRSYFSKIFKDHYKILPSQYLKIKKNT